MKLTRSFSLVALLSLGLVSVTGCAGLGAADDGDDTAEVGSDEARSRTAKMEIFVGRDGQHYFYLLAGNGERVLRSEGYRSEAAALNGAISVRERGVVRANFDLRMAVNGEWYFNLRASNGQVLASSETYVTRSNASRAITTVIRLLSLLPTNPTLTAAPTRVAFEVFSGENGQRYFRLRAANGEIVLASEGYTSRTAALNGVIAVRDNGTSADQYEIRESRDGQFYFVLLARNGLQIGHSELYVSRSNAQRGVDAVIAIVQMQPQIVLP